MEKTNFRYMVRDDIQDDLDFASCDVSFISLTKILLPARRLLKAGGEMVCLIKPQFEAGKEKVGKKGVVRDPKVHEEVVHRITDFVDIAGFEVLHLDYSPIKGPEGNIEYLIHIRKNPEADERVSELTEAEGEKILKETEAGGDGFSHTPEMEKLISETVMRAHGKLDN